MNLFGFVVRSFGFYWRRNVGLFLTAVVSAAVLAGALLVGDSVRYSLGRIVDLRLGGTDVALVGGDRFFGVGLADRVSENSGSAVAAVLQLPGVVSNSDGSRRVSQAAVVGVDGRFFDIGGADDPFEGKAAGVVVNELVAGRLGVKVGDEVVLRIGKPGELSRDVGLVSDSDISVVYRGVVLAVVGDEGFGRFGLRGDQTSPLNIFVRLDWLGEKIDKAGLCNTLLVAGDVVAVEKADSALKEVIELVDVGLEVKEVAGKDLVDIRSRRVFIGDYLSGVLMGAQGAKGHLTYFVNGIRSGDKVTPYSMVAGIEGVDIGDDEILINEWLAGDIGAKVGDSVEIEYYVMGDMRKLIERTSKFTVKAIVPVLGDIGDRELMPDFPGLSDAENCRDWDPGMPIDLDRIRDKDEVYWDDYAGTPKAFVSLAAGQKMWRNRFGGLTGVRFAFEAHGDAKRGDRYNLASPERYQSPFFAEILGELDPGRVGFSFVDVRGAGVKGASEATDFGQLFLGLSMFLIAAAMILTSLVFGFSVDNRSSEIGMLRAVGFTGGTVRRMFMLEAAGVALFGCIAGGALGVLYTKAMIYGLSSVWAGAVTGTAIVFYGKFSTVCIGGFCGFCVSLFSVWLSLRKHLRKEARELLSMGGEDISSLVKGGGKKSLWVSAAAFVGAVVIIFTYAGADSSAGAFFSAGGLLLIAGVFVVRYVLKALGGRVESSFHLLGQLAWRNSARRSGRSLAVVSLIAAGSFLVVSIGAFRHDPGSHVNKRDSGTGGFALFAESSIAIVGDLNDPKGRKKIALDDEKFADVRIVQMRVRDGDDASCLNLNRAQMPRVVGVDPFKFEVCGAFGEVKTMKGVSANVWEQLGIAGDDGIVNAVADNATVVWALGKKLGDCIDFVDSKGDAFKIRIVGVMGNSVLQGSLIISEDNFSKRFADVEGYRMFLVDVAEDISGEVSEKLSGALIDYGFDVSTTADRLGRFSEVENTYLSIFQLLGGLSLVLASVGLGLVVLVNVLDRQGELAMLRAVGFGRKRIVKMIVLEHSGLLANGLICGVLSAIIAIIPAISVPGREVGLGVIIFIIAMLVVSGILFIWFSAWFALRGELIDSLRKE